MAIKAEENSALPPCARSKACGNIMSVGEYRIRVGARHPNVDEGKAI